MSEYVYRCPCGHTYASELGKYGCPNCAGENAGRMVKVREPKPTEPRKQ